MIFTIDNDNDIRAHETETQAQEAAKSAAGTIVVRNEKELAKAAAEWHASRPAEIWNSLAGALYRLQAVKKFENRGKAVARIWAAIQRLGNAMEPKPADPAKPPKEPKSVTGKKAGRKAAQPAKANSHKGKKPPLASRARARTRRR